MVASIFKIFNNQMVTRGTDFTKSRLLVKLWLQHVNQPLCIGHKLRYQDHIYWLTDWLTTTIKSICVHNNT